MTEQERGTDRLGRRAKRFLTPVQKDEIWLQLVRGETTISEAADRYGVGTQPPHRPALAVAAAARCHRVGATAQICCSAGRCRRVLGAMPSLLITSSRVANPSVTIATLADRFAETTIEDCKRRQEGSEPALRPAPRSGR